MNDTVVIDFGMGNLRSVAKALEHVGARVRVSADPAVIRSAARVVFPGQGAIGACVVRLADSGLADAVREAALTKPFLGICLGLQALLEFSEEDGGVPGLGLVAGRVQRFADGELLPGGERRKVPHMGWNQVGFTTSASGAGAASRMARGFTSCTVTTCAPRMRRSCLGAASTAARRSPARWRVAICWRRSFIRKKVITRACVCWPTS